MGISIFQKSFSLLCVCMLICAGGSPAYSVFHAEIVDADVSNTAISMHGEEEDPQADPGGTDSSGKTGIRLNRRKVTLHKGSGFTLKAKVSSGAKPSFFSSRKKVATVNDKGVVRAKRKGICTITVCADGVRASCQVTVR